MKKPPATAPVKQENANKNMTKLGVPKSESDRLAVSVDRRWSSIQAQSTGHGKAGVDHATEDQCMHVFEYQGGLVCNRDTIILWAVEVGGMGRDSHRHKTQCHS